jgi:phage terminase large subunit-like protein
MDLLQVKRSHGIPDAVEIVQVRHASGGVSMLQSKAYEQGRKAWQGETLHGIWFDEEPPQDVYGEGLTRTNAFSGMALLTLTPMLGMSEVVTHFYPQPDTPERALVQMDISDAEHYSQEERDKIIRKYPKHEREARAHGIPMLGTGRVFPVPESDITVGAFEIPPHWPQVAGLDFGWDHPTAAARLAHDTENDVVYLIASYRVSEATIAQHVSALRKWGAWLPFAWPHDGWQHESGSGFTIAETYRKEGIRMLPEHAASDYGKKHVSAVTADMLDRMMTGRWKVFSHCQDWFEEFRLYHREKGKIVKLQDDLISASRTALMALRYARAPSRAESSFPATVGMDWDPLSIGRVGR